MLDIVQLHPLFAAKVTGLDVAKGVSRSDFETVHEAFERYSVLVFPDQRIDDAQQIAFSEQFGPLETTRVGGDGEGSKLVILTNIGPDGKIVEPTGRQILNNKANRHWHSDSSFKPVPARASMLSARMIPSEGGNTEFASMRAAYAALPDELRKAVAGRYAFHDFSYGRSKIDPNLVTPTERAALPPVRHPMVREDERYGPALYLGAHVARVDGMDEAEGRALIDQLQEFATAPQFVYSHRWSPHDLVLWDNRAVLHRATPFASAQERRHMVRTTIAGDPRAAAVAA